MRERPGTKARPLVEGGAAGLVLAVADLVASGAARTPAKLWAAELAAGLLFGLLAGTVAALLGRRGLAVGLVLAAGIALEGLSTASKEMAGGALRAGVAVTLTLAGATLVAAERRRGDSARRGARRAAWSALSLAALPAAVLAAAEVAPDPWVRVSALAAPLGVLALERTRAGARSPWLAVAWAALVWVLVAAQPARSAPSPKPEARTAAAAAASPPSIVMLVVDTLRADAPAQDGELARFARAGVTFRQCIGAAPWTLPAVSSLLTSLVPSRHGATDEDTPLPAGVTTLAEVLRDAGYATGGFTGGAFLGRGHGLDQGFEAFDPDCERRFQPFGPHLPLIWRVARNRYLPLRFLVRWVDEYRGLAGGLDAALRWARAEPRRPLFLFLHTYEVHDYYLYDPDVDDPVLAAAPPVSERFAGRLSVSPSELLHASQEDLDHFRALYDGRVAAVERLLPELVRELEPLVGKDAIWILTADHGEGFDAARGRVHHGGRLHDDLLHVPLVVRAPGRLPAGAVVDRQVRSIDVLPTVLALVGVAPPPGIDGESLLPALRGTGPFPGAAFAEERAHGLDLCAVRRDGWKEIRGPGGTARYHVAVDPGESQRLPLPPDDELSALLDAFAARRPRRAAPKVELDAVTRANLRALGYGR